MPDRAAIRTEAARTQQLLDLLTDTSSALNSTLDQDEGVRLLARLVVPALADWCIVSTTDADSGHLRDVAVAHADPTRQGAAEKYAAGRLTALDPNSPARRSLAHRLPAVAVGSGPDPVEDLVGQLVRGAEVRADLTALGPGSVLVVPLLTQGRVVGLMTLFRDLGRAPLDERELRAATDVAVRAGTALENARLFTEQQQLAAELQRSLLTEPPQPDHGQIAVRYLPAAQAAQVGGDWYDAFLQPGGTTVLVIGDVAGHDTAAAATMAQLRSLLRGIAVYSDAGPAEVLRGLDQAMDVLGVRTLATVAMARFEQDDDERQRGETRMRWSSAGHLPPLVLHAGGRVEVLDTARADLLLGVEPGTGRTESTVTLGRDATVLFYTDGLVERRDSDLDAGIERLRLAVAERHDLSLEQLCDALLEQLVHGRPDDDVALVAVRLHRQDHPRPPEAGPSRVPDPVKPGA